MSLLLRHDLELLLNYRKSIILTILALPLIMYIFSLLTLITSMLLIAIIMIVTNEVSGKLLNSLKTSRREIVIARYIFMSIATLIVIAYLLVIMYFLDSEYMDALAFFNFNVITLAFLMPLGFIFSSKSSNAIAVTFIIYNSFSLLIWDLLLRYKLISTIIALLLLVTSFLMSISIFSDREFD